MADASPREPPDVAVLTRGMVRGDEEAYRNFYDAYFNRLFRYLLVVTAGDEEATREALQATLVRVVRHIKVFSNDAAFWSWLTVLARSALSDQNRKLRRYLAFLDRFTRHARIQREAANDSQPDAKLLALLERGVASLSPDEQQLVEWKYHARRSVREIAEELHTTDNAVESRLSRIRSKLKEAVLSELKHDSPD